MYYTNKSFDYQGNEYAICFIRGNHAIVRFENDYPIVVFTGTFEQCENKLVDILTESLLNTL